MYTGMKPVAMSKLNQLGNNSPQKSWSCSKGPVLNSFAYQMVIMFPNQGFQKNEINLKDYYIHVTPFIFYQIISISNIYAWNNI